MSFRLRILLALLIMLGAIAAASVGQDKSQAAAPDSAATDTITRPLPWLHVEVETSYGWFWQRSTGVAYTTAGKDSKQRIKVGKLCLRLVAHDTTTQCLENADSITVFESKKGVGIKKCTAYVTAWTESPKLDTLRVQMAP